MNKVLNFLVGMIFGAMVGAAIALLFAPMSGEELRSTAQRRYEEKMNEVRTAMAEERRRLETELEALKHGEILHQLDPTANLKALNLLPGSRRAAHRRGSCGF